MMPAHDGSALARKVVRGMFVLIFFGIFLKLGGLLMSIIMSGFYGPGHVLDAYTEVFGVLLFVFFYSSALKVAVPAFMPLFAEEREKAGEEAAWRLTNTLLNLVLLVGGLAVVLGMVFSSQVVRALVPGFDPQAQSLASTLLRRSLPGAMVLLFAVMALGILNSYKIFSYPAAANAVHRLTWAVVLLVLLFGFARDPRTAMAKPVYMGFLIASAAQLAVLLFGMRSKLRLYRARLPALSGSRLLKETGIALGFAAAFGAWVAAVLIAARYSPIPDRAKNVPFLAMTGGTVILCAYCVLLWGRAAKRTGVMARLAALAGPLVIGVLFARYRDLITAYFQSFTQTGVFGGLELAKTVANLPIDLLPYSLSIAMFPYLCDLAARKDMGTFGDMLTRSVHLIALFFVPLTITVIILNRPIMELVFDRGNWSEPMLVYAGLSLALYGSGFFFYAVENVLMQSYFSIQRMWTPTLLGIAATVLHAAFLYVPIALMGFDSPIEIFLLVAISFPFSRAVKNLILMALLRIRTNFLPLKKSAIFAAKLSAVSAGVGLAAYLAVKPVQQLLPLRDLKGRVILLDTFNAEPRGWLSHDAKKLRVDADLTRYALGPGSGFDGNALAIEYTWRPGRHVSAWRDLSDFQLDGATGMRLSLYGRRNPPEQRELETQAWARFAVILERIDGARYETEVRGSGVHELALDRFETVGRGAAGPAHPHPATLARLGIEDRNDGGDEQPRSVLLLVDNIQFVGPGHTVTVDNFETLGSGWQSEPRENLAVAPVPGQGGNEMALMATAPPLHLTRSVEDYRLEESSAITFKAQATRPFKLLVGLVQSDGRALRRLVEIRQSENREKYRLELSHFEPVEAPPASGTAKERSRPLKELTFAEAVENPEEGTLWLDNIAFERPTRQAKYEMAKFLIVAVPAAAALAAFILLCWLLRVEEAATVTRWLLRRGWRERGKVPRGEGDDGVVAPE